MKVQWAHIDFDKDGKVYTNGEVKVEGLGLVKMRACLSERVIGLVKEDIRSAVQNRLIDVVEGIEGEDDVEETVA